MLDTLLRHFSLKKKFTDVYRHNLFGGTDSRSGEGSGPSQTAVIREEIPALLARLGVSSMIDAPCGDLFWMSTTELPLQSYLGVDIVEPLIRRNRELYGNGQRSFAVANLTRAELPRADLILCRDCLVHLSFRDALKVLASFKKSGAQYLLTTTFTERSANAELGSTFWRPLNLQLPPFNFPAPLELIDEKCSEVDGAYADKHLGLWRLQDLLPQA